MAEDPSCTQKVLERKLSEDENRSLALEEKELRKTQYADGEKEFEAEKEKKDKEKDAEKAMKKESRGNGWHFQHHPPFVTCSMTLDGQKPLQWRTPQLLSDSSSSSTSSSNAVMRTTHLRCSCWYSSIASANYVQQIRSVSIGSCSEVELQLTCAVRNQ